MKRIVLLVLAVVAMASAASAQSVSYPGSAWTSTGTASNVEKGNVISLNHAEQGIALRGAEVFALGTFQVDSKGYDWNNREILGAGIRFTQNIGPGMIRFGVIYSQERRRISGLREEGFQFMLESFHGWGRGK